MNRELTQRDIERMHIPGRYWGTTPESVTALVKYESTSAQLTTVLDNYVERIESMVAEGTGLLLHGDNGVGKTSALVLLAMEARRRGYSALYIEVVHIKKMVLDREPFDAACSLWERAQGVDILVLDDLGKGVTDSKGFMLELLDELLRTRGAHLRPTLISTNVHADNLVATGQLHKSTFEMLKETTAMLEVYGVNKRTPLKASLAASLLATSLLVGPNGD